MVEGYGGKIAFREPTQAAREAACARVLETTLANVIHPFEDELVMAGQGIATLEFLDEVPHLDVLLCPVRGGGLLAGTAVAAKSLRPDIRLPAPPPPGANDAARSFRAHARLTLTTVDTIADGLRTDIGEPNFAIVRQHVDDIVTVSEAGIVAAIRHIWEAVKIIVEPSAAVPYAAILERRIDVTDKRVGLILSGGNVDRDTLPRIEE